MNKLKEIFYLTTYDLKQRYTKTNLGSFWYILTPLVMIFIYTIVFADIMNARLGLNENKWAYSLYLIPGLFAFTALSNTVVGICEVPLSKASILKKVNIPLYIFLISPALIQIIIFLISICLGIIFLALVSPLHLNLLFLIPMILLQTIFSFSCGVIFSLFVPFFKDIKEALPIFFQLLFWATPIVYPAKLIEHKLPILLDINPVYYFIKFYQDLFLGNEVRFSDFIIPVILSLFSLALAAFLYKKMIASIKDVY